MPIVTFKPSGLFIEVNANSALLDAAKEAGVSVETPCGGKGICGKCLVRIESGKVEFDNNGALPDDMVDEGFVLICKAKVLDEDISVLLLTDFTNEKGKFSHAAEDILLVDKELLPTKAEMEPIVKKMFLNISEPTTGDGLSDLDRFEKEVLASTRATNMNLLLTLLKILPNVLREKDGQVTVSFYIQNEVAHIVDIEAGDTVDRHFGVAVDIGTTTISVQLVKMMNGEVVASKTGYNAQIECGLDVISRINYAKKPERLEELRVKVLETINGIINELASTNNIDKSAIYNASIAGNTVMMHLLLGIIPEYIRLEPYTPAVYHVPYYNAFEIGIEMNKLAPVYMAPSVGSYVGGDITSGILCTSLATESEELCLFIDIGTNGELIAGNSDFLIGCACSAGPAFEGGMRASQGAIERADIDASTGVATCAVIGNGKPVGICGSGMISLIAGLFKTGWIDAAGKFDRSRPCSAIEVNGKSAKYILAAGIDTKNGNTIYITEADIDNLIRAKAAIFSACRVMLQNINMDFEDLSKIYIAGGFGRYLDIDNAKTIGLIPNLAADKFVFLGNSSMTGAYMTLVSEKHREKELALAGNITYLDLSTEHMYMDGYTAALFLPHTDLSLFS